VFSVSVVLVLAAFFVALAAANPKVPLWPAVVLLTIVEMLQVWPR